MEGPFLSPSCDLAALWVRGLWEEVRVICAVLVGGLVRFQTLLSPRGRPEGQHCDASVCGQIASYMRTIPILMPASISTC